MGTWDTGSHSVAIWEVWRSSSCFFILSCACKPCFSYSCRFLFYWAAFLSISLGHFCLSSCLFFFFLGPCLFHAQMPVWGRAFCEWRHFFAFMEWADDIGSWPAALSNFPVQSYSCSLRVFYKTLVVSNDTY